MLTVLFREKRYLALVLLMIAALGAAAAGTIGRQEDPTITNIFATVVAPYPGAAPERVEGLITEKIESEIRQIAEIKNIDSTSRTGLASVRIELSEFTPKDRIEQVWSEIRDKLADAEAQFPAGAPSPEFDGDRIGAFTSISALTMAPGVEPSLGVLSRYAERLQQRLRRLEGVAFVEIYGAAAEEVRVEVDPARLSALGLAAADVSRAIAAADAKLRAGGVRGADADYLVEVAGELDGLDRVRGIPVATGVDGRIVRVGDVAELSRAVADPPAEIARVAGARAVLVAARMEPDLQVDQWMARVERDLVQFEAELPAGLVHAQIFDQSAYTFERLSDLAVNLAIGVAIVVLVLLVTLGWRSALIVGLVLPLASLLSLFVLQKIGIVVHQMSVTGLIVALGLLVDAAIVMTDDVRRRLAAGEARAAAVEQAIRRLFAPLLASTVTTILAFVPMALLPGPAGDFVGSIALAVMVMLTTSFLLALTVTPALAGLMLPQSAPGAPPARLGRVARLYRGLLAATLRARGAAALAAATPAFVGFAAFPTLTAQFFPGVERDQFYVQLTLPQGTAISATADAAARADAVLAADPEIAAVAWVVGKSAPAFYYNMQADQDGAPNFAEALVTTVSPSATERLVPALQTALDAAVPEAQTLVRGLVQGPPVGAPLEMRLIGPDLGVLRRLGEEARVILSELPAVTHTRATLSGGAPKLVFEVDEDQARLAGLGLTDVARQLDGLLDGVEGGSLLEGDEELPVRVRVGAVDRAAADAVLGLELLGPDAARRAARGDWPGIPLSSLGRLTLEPSESAITRRNGERVNIVQAFLQHGVLPEEALATFRERLAERPLDLPPGYRIDWGGDSDARETVVRNLMASVGVVVALTIASVVLAFNSWRLTAVAFVAAGLSMGLSLLALALFQYPFGINALIGVIGSIGVSINAAIIIMSALEDDPRARRGDRDAMVDVVMGASRHIVSTTVTTFGGFLPLILAGGMFWPPFATAIAGGVLLSTVTSLFFVPPLYSLAIGLGGRGSATALPPEAAAAPA